MKKLNINLYCLTFSIKINKKVNKKNRRKKLTKNIKINLTKLSPTRILILIRIKLIIYEKNHFITFSIFIASSINYVIHNSSKIGS